MAKKILVMSGSSSSESINLKLANLAFQELSKMNGGAEKLEIDLNDFELPLFSVDIEKDGIPKKAVEFIETIESVDGVIISLAEHNGSYSAAFKNIYDWASRHKKNVWSEKPMLLMSTSPGGRGGKSVFETAKAAFPRMGADIVASFSLPLFNDHYSENGLKDNDLDLKLKEQVTLFNQSISS